MEEEIKALRAEIAGLREEIALVRSAVARIPPPGYGVTEQGCFYQLPPGSYAPNQAAMNATNTYPIYLQNTLQPA